MLGGSWKSCLGTLRANPGVRCWRSCQSPLGVRGDDFARFVDRGVASRRLATFHWFHGFRRPTPSDIARVLHDGPSFHPDRTKGSHPDEARLSIAPPRVYAYLGRTHASDFFGENCIVLPPASVAAGDMTPFDTGGTLKNIHPIQGWSDGDKAALIQAYSWTAAERPAVLGEYPTIDDDACKEYLAGERPRFKGPHDVWGQRGPQVEMWSAPENTWPSWTWELRSPVPLPVADLAMWTCQTDVHPLIVDAAVAMYPNEGDWLELLGRTFVQGGPGVLMDRLREEQLR